MLSEDEITFNYDVCDKSSKEVEDLLYNLFEENFQFMRSNAVRFTTTYTDAVNSFLEENKLENCDSIQLDVFICENEAVVEVSLFFKDDENCSFRVEYELDELTDYFKCWVLNSTNSYYTLVTLYA